MFTILLPTNYQDTIHNYINRLYDNAYDLQLS